MARYQSKTHRHGPWKFYHSRGLKRSRSGKRFRRRFLLQPTVVCKDCGISYVVSTPPRIRYHTNRCSYFPQWCISNGGFGIILKEGDDPILYEVATLRRVR